MICSMKTVIFSSMRHSRTILRTALVVLAFVASVAHGAELAQVKGEGLVGERADGYLGLVQADAPAAVTELVDDVNRKRRTEYQRIAETNDLTLQEVQALAGKKAIERTAAGNWVMTNGGWRKK